MTPTKTAPTLHRAVRISDFGVRLKRVDPRTAVEPVRYLHCDDYYLFGWVEQGRCRIAVDFGEYALAGGELFCIRPGQIHRLIEGESLKASMLFVDAAFVEAADRRIFAEFALRPRPLRPDGALREELSALFAMIDRRSGLLTERPGAEESRRIIQRLAGVAAGIFADAVRQLLLPGTASRRMTDLALAFRELLDRERLLPGGPARYAAELHVSTGYLNEAVRSISGLSVGRCIRNELMLRAKRLLVHTSLDVRQIAFELGFGDAAYFSRLFTREAGISPTAFRRRYLG